MEQTADLQIPLPIRAAEYVRMSTEGQQYSIPYQQAAIRDFAERRGYMVVRTYADEGKSGLTLKHRKALIQLLSDVQEGSADYAAILVYDVSRWGRFQDTDEAGYYEYLCRKAGLRVEYCAEPFENDGGPLAAILKNIKRLMAAEYSREQSTRVHRATCRAAAKGYFTGGWPGYGFRRMLVGADGKAKRILGIREYKAIRDEHMILVPGPPEEVRTLRRIFRLYVGGKSPREIAEILNREGSLNSHGGAWRSDSIRRALTYERYVGTHTYNLRSRKLKKGPRHPNPPSEWVRTPGAFEPIIPQQLFEQAQAVAAKRRHMRHTEESLLARLRYLLEKHGYLSVALIKADAKPDFVVYRRKLGGARKAYARLGYKQPRDLMDHARAEKVRRCVKRVTDDLLDGLHAHGASVARAWPGGSIVVNDALTFTVRAMPYAAERKRPGWRLYITRKTQPYFTVLLRMDQANEFPLDYYLVPRRLTHRCRMRLGVREQDRLARYRFTTIDELVPAILRKTLNI
jgi:DNA invertase Pin-like site-specific DNA recombinase